MSSSWIGIAINNLIRPFDDKLVRQALRYAVDRDLVNQMAFLGLGAPNNDSPVWPGDSRFYAPEYEVEYDPEKARQLLAEAGYSDGIDITIATADLDPGMIELPAAFKQSAAAAGIRVDIKSHSSAQFWSQIYPYGPLTVFWNLVRPHPDHSLTIIFHSGSRWNTTYFGKQLVEGAEFAPFDREIFTVGPLAQELDALIERARGESLEQQKGDLSGDTGLLGGTGAAACHSLSSQDSRSRESCAGLGAKPAKSELLLRNGLAGAVGPAGSAAVSSSYH